MLRNLFLTVALSAIVISIPLRPVALSAQQAPDVPTVTIRANTRLVMVDVVVTDKKGNLSQG